MSREPDRLAALAVSVAEGSPIDWVAIESSADDPRERDLIRQLRIVAAVADVHRSAAPPEHDTTAVASPTNAGSASDLGRAREVAHLGEPGEGVDEGVPAAWGHLVILERVGRGSFGTVYRARDTQLDRDVALKLLQPSRVSVSDRVLEEGRLLARIRHANVVTIHGAERLEGRVGLWMEFIRGLTLEEVLARQGPFGAREATLVALDLCRALAAIHGAGLLHRDVKAQNVMREQGGRIVLMDFGTGVNLRGPRPLPESPLAGTPLYLAPELFRGAEPTAQSDQYSLGVLLFHLVTGAFPVQGRSIAAIADAHDQRNTTLLRDERPDLPEAFVRVVERALHAEPERRFDTAGRMEAALAESLGFGGTSGLHRRLIEPVVTSVANTPAAVDVATPAAPSLWRRRPRMLAAASALATLLLAVAGTTLWNRAILGNRSDARTTVERPRIESIAVLPLENLSGEPDYFVDGMTEALITDLTKIRAIRVISRTSAMQYRMSRETLPVIGQALGVDGFLVGSVLRSGPRIRINVRLVQAATDANIWANSYERELRDVLSLQADVARAVAQEISISLTPQDEMRLSGARPVDPEAYEAYLEGRYYWNKRTPENVAKAIELFEHALGRDTGYAAAYAGLADAYTLLGSVEADNLLPRDAMARAKAAAEAALAIDDRSSDAHTSLAMIRFWYDWDWAGAEREFQRALDLNPGYATAHHWYAIYLSAMGRHDAAIAEINRAQALDPLSTIIRANVAWVEYHARHYDQAAAACLKTLELDPQFIRAQNYLGMVYVQQGKLAEAKVVYERASKLLGEDASLGMMAYANAATGNPAEAHRYLDRLLAHGQTHYISPNDVAQVYAALGDYDRVFAWLDRALEQRSYWLVYLKVHPRFDRLRSDPRFSRLLERLNLSN